MDLGTAIAVLTAAVSAGSIVYSVRQNAAQAVKHGTRIGAVETRLAELEGYQRGIRGRAMSKAVPVRTGEDDSGGVG